MFRQGCDEHHQTTNMLIQPPYMPEHTKPSSSYLPSFQEFCMTTGDKGIVENRSSPSSSASSIHRSYPSLVVAQQPSLSASDILMNCPYSSQTHQHTQLYVRESPQRQFVQSKVIPRSSYNYRVSIPSHSIVQTLSPEQTRDSVIHSNTMITAVDNRVYHNCPQTASLPNQLNRHPYYHPNTCNDKLHYDKGRGKTMRYVTDRPHLHSTVPPHPRHHPYSIPTRYVHMHHPTIIHQTQPYPQGISPTFTSPPNTSTEESNTQTTRYQILPHQQHIRTRMCAEKWRKSLPSIQRQGQILPHY